MTGVRGQIGEKVRKIGKINGVNARKERKTMAKEKMAVYFQPETMRKIEQEYQNDNCASKTEFIEKAVGPLSKK